MLSSHATNSSRIVGRPEAVFSPIIIKRKPQTEENKIMELGAKIRQLRTERSLSQEALAHALGVSRQAVTKWEAGAALPSTANLLALCDLFGVPMSELTGSQEPSARRMPRSSLYGAVLLGVSAGLAVLTVPAWIFQSAKNSPDNLIGMADEATGIWVTGAPVLLYVLTGLAVLCAAAAVFLLFFQKRKK
ncbi:MAG TPA: helix-turn-helix transcriptional regulator [Candidatus Ventrousia excrementavium]|uniref:Helix-turn-helix transcriptional regulator n=1 Tax=Candidatus Ventrousia excrementavium TaxID=2840961 RepID=A0A9D1LKJ5_9CLOT|nr:helix-turn-helix transcriptional regulator [Candidatus Ventrousia excrementavium]